MTHDSDSLVSMRMVTRAVATVAWGAGSGLRRSASNANFRFASFPTNVKVSGDGRRAVHWGTGWVDAIDLSDRLMRAGRTRVETLETEPVHDALGFTTAAHLTGTVQTCVGRGAMTPVGRC